MDPSVASLVAASAQASNGAPDLSIVVPAFNEAQRLGNGMAHLREAFDLTATEVILVDDGSTDGTAELATEVLDGCPQWTVLRFPVNRGKGAAVRTGVARANGRAIAFMDADVATDPGDLPRLVSELESADVVIGSRAVAGAVASNAGRGRPLMGAIYNRLIRAVTDLENRDTQCGCKVFRANAAKLLFFLSEVDGYSFDVEVLALASRLGLRIQEVPVHWVGMPGGHVRPLHDAVHMAVETVRIAHRTQKLEVTDLPGRRRGPFGATTANGIGARRRPTSNRSRIRGRFPLA